MRHPLDFRDIRDEAPQRWAKLKHHNGVAVYLEARHRSVACYNNNVVLVCSMCSNEALLWQHCLHPNAACIPTLPPQHLTATIYIHLHIQILSMHGPSIHLHPQRQPPTHRTTPWEAAVAGR